MTKTEHEWLKADRERTQAARVAGSVMTERSILEYLSKGLCGFWSAQPYVKESPRGNYRPILRYRYETV